jgi:outer membrane protein assembly factor BamA
LLRPLAIVFLLAVLPPFVSAQDYCQKQFVVSQVNLQTDSRLEPWEQAAVRARLIGRCFDNGETGELHRQVLIALYNLGYLDATASEPSITVSDAGGLPQSVSLDVELVEGARYRVREVEIIGNRVVPSEQIMSVSQVQLGGFLDMAKVQETVEAIRKFYAANGYGKVSIKTPSVLRKEGLGVCLAFKVVEAPRSP